MTRQVFASALMAILFASVSSTAAAEKAPVKKLLVIGIDGCRYDALRRADTPNIDRLLEQAAVAEPIRIYPARYREADTISGPGWSSILTGVWADKHGVLDNEFKSPNYEEYPHFFALLKQARPEAVTASFSDWAPIAEEIVSHADVVRSFPSEKESYVQGDADVTEAAAQLLENGELTAVFVYLGQVDETGHAHGFHPSVPQYMDAIERVDRHIGELMEAIANRNDRAAEDWLVLVTTDHGGRGTGHGGGHEDPDVAVSFIIASGPSVKPGPIDGESSLVDLVPTGLTHLGIEIDPAWKLDGLPLVPRAR